MKLTVLAVLICFLAFASARVFNPSIDASVCDPNKCKTPNCQCSGVNPSIGSKTPQFVVLSFDDAIGKLAFDTQYKPLLFNRKNKDGCLINGTFFVPHEYTDYTLVNELYNRGFQIGSHSITKRENEYWRNASINDIKRDMGGQRTVLSKFANIPIESIIASRIPNFQLNADNTYIGLKDAGFNTDNSWPTFSSQKFFPYTLDYTSRQPCLVGKCPTSSIPGLWIAPIVNWLNQAGEQCNKLLACDVHGNKEVIFEWMKTNFFSTYNNTRAPFSLVVNSAWFTYTENAFEGLSLFLDYLNSLNDVYIVSEQQVINWMKNPVANDKYKSCETKPRPTRSCQPINCKLEKEDGKERYMGSCIGCPKLYPSIDNPEGK